MDKVESKISMRQFFIIFVIGVAALVIRIVPKYSSYFAEQNAWISSLVALIPMFLLLYILFKIMRNGKDKSFEESLTRIIGKTGAKVVMFAYLITSIIFLTFRIRYFAEKCMASIFTSVQIEFFIISLLVVVYLITRNNIQGFARFSEFIWIPLLLFVGAVFFITVPDIKISNLYPVTIYDMDNILMGSIPITAIFVYLPCMLFLGEHIKDKENFLMTGIKYVTVAATIGVVITFTTIGVFGSKLARAFTQPYFIALKNIQLFTVLERMEALAITFWIVTDIVLIIALVYVITELLTKIFNLKSRKNMITPVLFLEYILSIYVTNSIFELEDYSKGLGGIIYIAFGVALPVVIYLIGKARKVIT